MDLALNNPKRVDAPLKKTKKERKKDVEIAPTPNEYPVLDAKLYLMERFLSWNFV